MSGPSSRVTLHREGAIAEIALDAGPLNLVRKGLSNRFAKKLVDAAQDLALDAALSLSTGAQQRIFDSDDLHEGVQAFFAKREPRFAGR